MNHPYRGEGPAVKLPKRSRRLARFKRVWSWIAEPAIFLGAIFAIGTGINVASCAGHDDHDKIQEAHLKRHFEDWEAAIEVKQHAADVKASDIDRREHEVNARIRNFEDVLNLSPMLMKDGDPRMFLELIKKSKSQGKD